MTKKPAELLPIFDLNGLNGLIIKMGRKIVYNVGLGVDNKPNGIVVKIDVVSLESERVGTDEELLDASQLIVPLLMNNQALLTQLN